MIKGQILPDSNFCKDISNILSNNTIQTIVEIGTWKGLGSTKCIIDTIIANKFKIRFISIESNLDFHTEAKTNLVDFASYVELIYGRIVEPKDILEYVSSNNVAFNQSWLDSDIADMKNNTNVLSIIPETIDFLLLDGGEYSTYLEWTELKNRTKIVALDDTTSVKCNRIRSELLNDSTYIMLVDSNERNGYSIFRKK